MLLRCLSWIHSDGEPRILTANLNAIETLMAALTCLFLGAVLNRKITFLTRYNIPEPVVGGFCCAVLMTLVFKFFDVSISFDEELRDITMLAFFATIGLGANVSLLRKGGNRILVFTLLSTLLLVVQNLVGIGAAQFMGLNPLIGLLAGSITMAGGHGTGATYAAQFSVVSGGMEIAMASATCGLLIGGVIGGPIAQYLIARHKLAPEDRVKHPFDTLKAHGINEPELVTVKTTFQVLFILAFCIIAGTHLAAWLSTHGIIIPKFVGALFMGIITTNVLSIGGLYKLPEQTVTLLSVVSLSVFLAIALMGMKLWHLVGLAGPIAVLLTLQALTVAAFTTFVTFRVMGSDYEAAVMTAGQCGFGLGATPTAIANMEAVVLRYAAAPEAFLSVSLVGSFFIDIVNASVIQLFLFFLGT